MTKPGFAFVRFSFYCLGKHNYQGLILLYGLFLFIVPLTFGQEPGKFPLKPGTELLLSSQVSLEGLLGQAISASEKGRLTDLPSWRGGELIRMFSPASREASKTNDWYGEHAGKWLYTSARAAHRSGNENLKKLVFETADYLVSTQEENGYLGTYSPERRITNPQATSHATSWDVWNLSYMVLGLLEVNRYFPNEKYLDAALKIGKLFLNTFGEGGQNITGFGTRRGISATVILDPILELYRETGDKRYMQFAIQVIGQMEEKEGLHLVSDALAGRDMENVGDGKAYQLLWNLTALAKLYQFTGITDYLRAAENAWMNIKTYHLSITGGPWGGIGKHKECFNSRGFWSPYGYIETCSVMAWMQFNREMLRVTGEARYAEEIERTAYNALLGARYTNGRDWCYHSFTNGPTHTAHFNDCCPSSGALTLEELPPLVYSLREGGVSCNVYAPGEAFMDLPAAGKLHLRQETEYPFDGRIRLTLTPSALSVFPFFIRIPDWADKTEISVNGKPAGSVLPIPGEYYVIERKWERGDVVEIHFPLELRLHRQTEISNAPQQGGPMYKIHWYALSRGPLVYAVSGLLGGMEREGVWPLPEQNSLDSFSPAEGPEGTCGPAYEFRIPGKAPLLFLPYFEAAVDRSGEWRLTWLQGGIE